MHFLQSFRRLLIQCESWLAAASLLSLLLLISAQIISRNLFDMGLPAADALSRQLVLFVTFFGAILAVERQQHITIDVASAIVPALSRKLIRPLYFIAGSICSVLSFAAIRFWLDAWTYKTNSDQWQVIVGLIIPVGFILLALHFMLTVLLGIDSTDERHP